jgi:hypothetical protein|nr:MAG: hypothetical protein [Lake Baikal virophage 1]
MSVSSIINSATGKIYDDLIPQGGGVALTKGQLISANSQNPPVEVAVPVGANGTVLMADSNAVDGLSWAVVPAALQLAQGQLISADLAGDATLVTAPVLPAQDKYVLTATAAGGALGTNMAWSPATGAGGIIDTLAPLVDVAGQGTNTISIGFTAGPAGQIPYGTGVLNTGALTNVAGANQILGVNNGVPTWIDAGASGVVTATLPLVESAGVGGASNIAINFTQGQVGQIPYGTGVASTGALTNVAGANQILGVSNGVPTWKDAGASGVVTATLPLVESAGVGGASNVAIDFTLKGQIPVGTLPAGTGDLIPVGTDKQILTANSKLTYGMEWVDAPTSVSTVIVRSNDATKSVSPPQSNTDTLILVAEDTGATWDAEPASVFGFPSDPYMPSFVFTTQNQNEYCVNQEYIQQSAAVKYLTAVLYQTFPVKKEICQFFGIANQVPTFVCNVIEHTANNVFIMGCFNSVVPIDTPAQPFPCYNIAKLDTLTNIVTTFSPNSWGLAPDFPNSPLTNGSVQGCLVPILSTNLIFYGSFNSVIGTSGGSLDDGYLNVAIYSTTTETFLSSQLSTNALQFGFFKPAGFNPTYPNYIGGEVRGMFEYAFTTSYQVGGDFTNVGSVASNSPIEGICAYNYNNYARNTTNTPLGPSPIIINSMVSSISNAGSLLVCGSITNNISFILNTSALTVAPITGIIPPAGQIGGYGCIYQANSIVPAPNVPATPMDVVMLFGASSVPPYYDPIIPVISTVYYFTMGTLSTVLPAANIIYTNNFMGQNIIVNPYLGTITPPPQPTLLALGSSANYLWDTDDTTSMVFNMTTGKFINKYTNPPYANFTMIAGSSQSFISNESATNWIVTNGITVGGVFS